MRRIDLQVVAVLLLLLLSAVTAFAANDPGHDTLYVLKIGDSEVIGSINLTSTLNASYVRAATLLYGDQLDIRANGTIQDPTSRPALQATASSLYIDGNGNLLLNTRAGSSGIIQMGSTATNAITLNVSGTIRQQGVAVCLSNGTNCISGNNSGNVSSVSAGSGLSDSGTASDPVLNVNVGDGLSISGDTIIINNASVCRTDGTGCPAASGDGAGWANTSTLVYSASNSTNLSFGNASGSLPLFFVDATSQRVGIGTGTPTSTLYVRTTSDVNNTHLRGSSNNNYVLSVENGGGTAKGVHIFGGNSGSDASLLVVNSFTGTNFFTVTDGNSYFQNGNVGINTSNPGKTLEVVGDINATRLCIGTDCRSAWPAGGSDNTSWNESYASTLYYPLSSNPSGYLTAVPYQSSAGGWQNTSSLVSLVDPADNVTIDTVYFDNTNNYVGIGVASPSVPLHVNGSTIFTSQAGNPTTINITTGSANEDAQILFTENGPTSRGFIGTVGAAGNNLYLSAGNNLNLILQGSYLTGSGNMVGIGTATPGAKVEINNTLASDEALILRGATSQTGNLFTIMDASSNFLFSFYDAGSGAGALSSQQGLIIAAQDANDVALRVRGNASQTANLQQWQNGSNTTLAYVDVLGNAKFAQNITINDQVIERYSTFLRFPNGILLGTQSSVDTTALQQIMLSSTTNGTVVRALPAGSTMAYKIVNYSNNTYLHLSIDTQGNISTIGLVNASQLCIANDCRTSWPAVGSDNTSWNESYASTLYYPLSSNPSGYLTSYTETDPLWSGNASLVYLNTNPYGFYNSTTLPAQSNAGGWSNSSTLVRLTSNSTNVSVGNTTGSMPILFVDSTDGRVGLGTTTPQSKLDINNSGSQYGIKVSGNDPSNANIALNNSGGSVWQISSGIPSVTNSGFALRDISQSATRMVIDSNGLLGLGTSVPTQKLDVNGSVNVSGTSAKVYTPEICLAGDCQTSWPTGGGGNITGSGSANYLAKWSNATALTSGTITDNGNVTIDTNTLVVDGTNNRVGLGTTAPSALLHINTTGATEAFMIGHAATGTSNNERGIRIIPYSDGNIYLDHKTYTNGTVYFRAGAGTETGAARTWMVVNATTANIGMGTTSPTQKLHVVGSINVSGPGNIYYQGNLTGYGADLAEFVHGSGVSAGDVVILDPSNDKAVIRAAKPYDTRVAGIISTDPSHVMSADEGNVPLALAGRVPVKVTSENGMIKRGDLLTTSSTPGHAMKCVERSLCAGAIVGKAMENQGESNMITALVVLG